MSLLSKIKGWFRREPPDPAAAAEAQRLREAQLTRRVGDRFGPDAASHSGKQSERGF